MKCYWQGHFDWLDIYIFVLVFFCCIGLSTVDTSCANIATIDVSNDYWSSFTNWKRKGFAKKYIFQWFDNAQLVKNNLEEYSNLFVLSVFLFRVHFRPPKNFHWRHFSLDSFTRLIWCRYLYEGNSLFSVLYQALLTGNFTYYYSNK